MDGTPHIKNIFETSPHHGYGYGGGQGWSAAIGAAIGSALFRRGGLGGDGTSDAALVTAEQTATLMQNGATNVAALTASGTAGFAAVQNRLDSLGTNITQGQIAGFNAMGNRMDQLANGLVMVGDKICDLRYESAQQTNQILSAICASTNTIKDRIQSSDDKVAHYAFADLERKLAVAENGGPRTQSGAWVPVNPCHNSQGADQINQLTQVVIGLGNQVSALQAAVGK